MHYFCQLKDKQVMQQTDNLDALNALLEGLGNTIGMQIVERGHRMHVWNVDIRNEKGEIVSTERVTNMIIKKERK